MRELESVKEQAASHELTVRLRDWLIHAIERDSGPGESVERGGTWPSSEVLQGGQDARKDQNRGADDRNRLQLAQRKRSQCARGEGHSQPIQGARKPAASG